MDRSQNGKLHYWLWKGIFSKFILIYKHLIHGQCKNYLFFLSGTYLLRQLFWLKNFILKALWPKLLFLNLLCISTIHSAGNQKKEIIFLCCIYWFVFILYIHTFGLWMKTFVLKCVYITNTWHIKRIMLVW